MAGVWVMEYRTLDLRFLQAPHAAVIVLPCFRREDDPVGWAWKANRWLKAGCWGLTMRAMPGGAGIKGRKGWLSCWEISGDVDRDVPDMFDI